MVTIAYRGVGYTHTEEVFADEVELVAPSTPQALVHAVQETVVVTM